MEPVYGFEKIYVSSGFSNLGPLDQKSMSYWILSENRLRLIRKNLLQYINSDDRQRVRPFRIHLIPYTVFKVKRYTFRGNNFVSFFYLFLKQDQLPRERICSCRSKFFPLRVDPFLVGFYQPEKPTASPKGCSPLQKWQNIEVRKTRIRCCYSKYQFSYGTGLFGIVLYYRVC